MNYHFFPNNFVMLRRLFPTTKQQQQKKLCVLRMPYLTLPRYRSDAGPARLLPAVTDLF